MSEFLAHFLDMGGYGFYVWGSYIVTLGALLIEPVLVSARRRKALKQVTGS